MKKTTLLAAGGGFILAGLAWAFSLPTSAVADDTIHVVKTPT